MTTTQEAIFRALFVAMLVMAMILCLVFTAAGQTTVSTSAAGYSRNSFSSTRRSAAGSKKDSRLGDGERHLVVAELESGKRVHGDALIYAVGRQANGDQLQVEAAGLTPDSRGRLKVNEFFQTDVPHIYAAGDVIGFPALASTSMEQGRLAASHMFGIPFDHMPELLPYGIYTIPEISMVGETEESLTRNKVPYEVGIARYSELAKSMMLGGETGMLRLLIDRNTRKLLGAHALGQRATEIIHIGRAVLFYSGSIEYSATWYSTIPRSQRLTKSLPWMD